MEVEILIPRSGPNGAYSKGATAELSEDEARRLIEAGKARPIASKPSRRKKATTESDEER